ncbi:MAG: hypothetical protein KC618_02875, partial [Candidatus Omnitrophica bacterium]|nr:hypothetical protein [Candidatus Omnitrophota bacterium]
MNKVFPAIVLSAFLLKASIVSAGIKQLKDTGDGFNAESEEVEANLSQVIGEAYSLKDKIHTVIEEIRLIQARDSGKTPQERMSIQDLVDYSEQLQDLIVTLSQKAADLLEVQDQVVAMRQKIVLKELSLNLKEKQVHSSDTEVFDLEEKKILISRLEREKEELLQKMSGLYQENQKIIQQMQEWKEAGTEAADDSQQQLTELKEKWQSESAEIEKNLHSLQEENRRLTAQLQESNKQRLQLTQSVEKYQKNAEDVNSRTKTLSQTNEQLEDRIVQLTDKADAVELLLSQKEQEMTLLTNNLAQLKQELEDKNLVITKWESGEMQNFQNVEKQVEEAKRPLEDKIDSLKEEIQQILVDADRKVQ